MPSLSILLRNPLFLISSTALLTLLLSVSVFQRQQTTLLEQNYGYYGNALARLAASQATDATLNHDLVSLQVTVRDVASNPLVLSTTIHDVENQLLVQSGSSPNTRAMLDPQIRTYTAPITFQDSIAGKVTVTLAPTSVEAAQDDAWFIGLIAVCVTLLVLSLLNLRKAESEAPEDANPDLTPAPLPGRSSGPINLHSSETPTLIGLTLQCLNLERLQAQLSSALLGKLTDQVERCLSGVNTIYSGRISAASEHCIELHFQGDDRDNTVFRALCAGRLFFQLLDQSAEGVRLQYTAAVLPVQRSASLQRQIEFAQLQRDCAAALQALPANSLLLHAQDCASATLLQRLQVQQQEQQDATWLQVQDLQPTYSGLLDKQAQQLAGLVQSASPR